MPYCQKIFEGIKSLEFNDIQAIQVSRQIDRYRGLERQPDIQTDMNIVRKIIKKAERWIYIVS